MQALLPFTMQAWRNFTQMQCRTLLYTQGGLSLVRACKHECYDVHLWALRLVWVTLFTFHAWESWCLCADLDMNVITAGICVTDCEGKGSLHDISSRSARVMISHVEFLSHRNQLYWVGCRSGTRNKLNCLCVTLSAYITIKRQSSHAESHSTCKY